MMIQIARKAAGAFLLTAGLFGVSAASSQTTPSAPAAKAQESADQKAYSAARKVEDPAQKLAAFQAFVRDYPKSSRVGRAQSAILDVLLKSFPERKDEIDAQAKLLVKQAHKGDGRRYEESDVAQRLANAGPAGVDLKRAESYASDVVKQTREDKFDAERLKLFSKYNMAAPKPEELHRQYANNRAGALATLALVYFQEGKIEQAQSAAAEAYTLDPRVDDVSMVRGRLALRRGDKAEALADFEQATLLGSLDEADRKQMFALYRAAHAGSDAGMAAEMDARYAQLFPADLPMSQHAPFSSGHTVLLSLFTGSACGPCVGGDLAVEGILASYPRSEVVALAFDQHIPDPDPLANPDSLAIADLYKVRSTPHYLVDGQGLELYGGDRSAGKKLYGQLTGLLDQEAATPTGAQINLAGAEEGGTVTARAQVTLGTAPVLQAQVARKIESVPPPDPNAPKPVVDKKAAKKKKNTSAVAPAKPATAAVPETPAAPAYQVNFALVEDEVRYSGENGIRFHRMVVRALAKPAGEGFSVKPGETVSADATFDPAAISAKWSEYLTKFEAGNDRFSKFTFISKDTAMNPKHLAVAAWVEDKATHRILQAAFVPVGGAE